MKYIAIRLDDNTVYLQKLMTETTKDSLNAAINVVGLYFLEVADNYNTGEIFDLEPVVTIATADDKNNPVVNFTIDNNYDVFKENVDKQTSYLIKEWCRTQGKNEAEYQRLGIENGNTDADFVAYKNEVATIKTSQAAKKANKDNT